MRQPLHPPGGNGQPAVSDWLESYVRMSEFLKGVPQIVVPDQLHPVVKDPWLSEPQLDPSYRERY